MMLQIIGENMIPTSSNLKRKAMNKNNSVIKVVIRNFLFFIFFPTVDFI